MKKILLIILMFCGINLIAQGSYEEFRPTNIFISYAKVPATTGAYFDGEAWIFFPHSDPLARLRMQYCRIKIKPNGDKELITDDDGVSSFKIPVTVENSQTGASAISYKGMLYLFWTDANDRIKFTRTDGENWSEPAFVGEFSAKGKNMATSVMNGNLFLLIQENEGAIRLLKSKDGTNWNVKRTIFTNSDNIGQASLGLTTFINKSKYNLLIAVNKWNNSVITLSWNNDAGIYDDVSIPGAVGKGISLVTGRVAYGTDIETLPVQIVIHGSDNKIWIASYNPENSTWFNLHKINEIPDNRFYYSVPSAFSNFKFKNDSTIVKQVWFCTYVRDLMLSWEKLGIYSVKSETLKKDETVSNDCMDDPALWSLIGVVEGPPPYVLNGQNISDLEEPPSIFTYGTVESTEIINSSEWEVSTSTSINIPLIDDIFSCGMDMGAAINDGNETKFTTTYSVSKSVEAGDYSLGYYYFEVPKITRFKYKSYLPSGAPTGEYQYIFTVTGASLHAVDFPLEIFDPNDINTYLNNEPSASYARISEKGFQWSVQSPWESVFSIDTAITESEGSTLSVGGSLGVAEILDVGANYTTTFSRSHSTQFGQSITVSLNSPNPRSGHTEDIKSFSGVAYWLKAEDSNAFWIPNDFQGNSFKDQRPWCVTWSVNNITYNDLTDVNQDSKIPLSFSLSQNYPNPFNPTTEIKYTIPQSGFVELKVYDVLGREVASLVNKEQSLGNYKIEFNASNLTSGIYIYRINTGNYSNTKKMILLQ